MKTSLRSTGTAAALLLLSIGATLASQSASAQYVDGPGRPAVVAPGEFRGDRDRDRDRREHRRDDRGPWISDLTPAQGERVGGRGFTRISARFGDERSGVDPASVLLRIDGRDVTRRARVDGDDIRYVDDLRPGRHVAELVVRDRAGNPTRRAWAFDVVDHGRHDRDHGGERW
ncbi:hypothetical protein ACFPOE_13315 [Caenimonas terrae]|uniref:Uncharacterized protein n=1 Tax=Caenimonas terrae TaxID=696074 RepID=A0ABW0NHW2_9BURK